MSIKKEEFLLTTRFPLKTLITWVAPIQATNEAISSEDDQLQPRLRKYLLDLTNRIPYRNN